MQVHATPIRRSAVLADTTAPANDVRPAPRIRRVQDYVYQALPLDKAAHDGNVLRLYEQLERFILDQLRAGASPTHLFDAVSANIVDIFQRSRLELGIYGPINADRHGYGKYLLFSSLSLKSPQFEARLRQALPRLTDDEINDLVRSLAKTNAFCVQGFRFAPRQRTRPHNHICACTSTILQNRMKKSIFRQAGDATVQRIGTTFRSAELNTVSKFSAEEKDVIHALKNSDWEQSSFTGHVYPIHGMGTLPARVSSMNRAFELASVNA